MPEQLTFQLPLPRSSLIQLWTPAQIYEQLDSSNIESFVEDRRIERKGVAVQPKTLAEYLSMWANTQPHGGIIVVGVDDQGRLAGCKSHSAVHLNNLEHFSELCPDARYISRKVQIKNSRNEEDFILVFLVHYNQDKVVETSGGKAFIREGDKKIELSDILKRELRIAKGEIHHELERVNLKFPADFDMPEVAKFCEAYKKARKYPTDKSYADLLVLAKLGKKLGADFLPNLACALLFAKEPREIVPGARIRVIRYQGAHEKFGSEMNAVFSTFVDGNVAKLLFEAKPVISSQLRTFQRYDRSGRLLIQPEYPEEAWFEAVVNAVAHRSYNLRNQNIFVKIFDDRFVVESPGGFVPPTTAATVYDTHNPRNPYLMEAMMHLELTFCGFEGTRRMRNAMRVASLPEPRFRQVEIHTHQVHVALENNQADRSAKPLSEILFGLSADFYSALSTDERKLLDYFQTAQNINIATAALIIRKSWPTAQKVVFSLVDKGVLSPADSRRKKHDSTKSYALAKQRVQKTE